MLRLLSHSRCPSLKSRIFSICPRQSITPQRLSSTILPTYEPASIEKKWQQRWATEPRSLSEDKPAYYALTMFPYPSGYLHMGHVRVYTLSDAISRVKRLQGHNVFQPMGWDSFGLPAENAALDRGVQPQGWTKENIQHMKSQLIRLGTHFDWENELSTCDPEYYKWTQWLFLELYKKGMAYQKEAQVNWDPIDQTVLANEQVDGEGRSWRSGAVVEKKMMRQWFFRITQYADVLSEGLDQLKGWPDTLLQKNWIGKSQGLTLRFDLEQTPQHDGIPTNISVFTTRADTLFGVSFVAIAADHPQLKDIVPRHLHADVLPLCKDMSSKDVEERRGQGVFTGTYAVHPYVPVWAADYVLSQYGTGAVMGVPAHDERDYQFAKKYDLPVIPVIKNPNLEGEGAYEGQGEVFGSEWIDGMDSVEARERVIKRAQDDGLGQATTSFKLRDWLVSRQRYWGAPIPMIHCTDCGVVPVPEEDLPVLLPDEVDFKGSRSSPLANMEEWYNCKCPKCNKTAKRELDTMDTFVDSSWYFLRFPDAKNDREAFSKKRNESFLPVDVYIGGIEHAILHLLYSRFIHRFLHDQKHTVAEEPFVNLITQGMVHGRTYKDHNGKFLKPEEVTDPHGQEPKDMKTGLPVVLSSEKMSKSKYNGVDPQPIIDKYGADTVRTFMLFKAPVENVLEWDIHGIIGAHRWLSRIWSLVHTQTCIPSPHSTVLEAIEKASEEERDLMSQVQTHVRAMNECVSVERHGFNVAVANLMKLSNLISDAPEKVKGGLVYTLSLRCLLVLLTPIAPHIGHELWDASNAFWREKFGLNYETTWAGSFHGGKENKLSEQRWPVEDEKLIVSKDHVYAVMINAKKRGTISVSQTSDEEETRKLVEQTDTYKKYVGDKAVKKVIIKGSVINIVL
ncbi:leucyl-tRNA synthetase [Planoprotostelium fungivorum]|uniref:leucine--tRNA ligase n=1 Tax=Planoprotostelium fungivorum TaxID=1890364 RepID=A0A2P6NV34_9EUKA|nr:leucyl-tRNA synthetase [Planoprotostelium fungivorum]